MRNINIIIGLTGRFGAGCTVTYDLLTTEESFTGFSLSGYLKVVAQKDEEYKKSPKKHQRSYLQNLGDNIRKKEGQNFLAKKVIEKINELNNNHSIVVDSFKNPAEVNEFRNNFPNFYLFAIDSETEERWNRTKKIYDKDRKVFDEDDERDKGSDDIPYEGQQVKTCMNIADILINSDKSFYNLDETINQKVVEV